MQNRRLMPLTLIIVVLMLSAGCTSSGPPPASPLTVTSPPADQQPVSPAPSGTFVLRVASLDPGSVLPGTYTCKGAGESPGIAWDGVPAGTKSLVLVLEDPDAPNGRFTHWIVYNLPPVSGELAGAQPNAKVLDNGAQQGDTSAGSRGYYPPCLPVGATHRYVFRLYAVDMDITQPTADRDSVDWALTGHTIAETKVTTTFRR